MMDFAAGCRWLSFGANPVVRGAFIWYQAGQNNAIGVTAMTLNATGDLGIGVAPTSRLHVVATKTIASAAGAVYDGIKFAASAVSITGNTGIATAAGFNFTTIQAPTIAGDTATCAITHAATLTVTAAPIAGANVTIANPYAFWVQAGNTRLDGGQIRKGVDVNAAGPYVVTATDYMLEVRYTATGAISINLPSIAAVGNGRILVSIDSGYNAAVNNITLVRNGADKINNVAGNYVQNVSGSAIWLKANATTSNWELV